MSFFKEIRRILRRPSTVSRVGRRRPSTQEPPVDALKEDELRSILVEDPNDEKAFNALAEIVRRRAVESRSAAGSPGQELTAPPPTPEELEQAADDAVWALAEELAGNPNAWRPLIELARLSVHTDHDGALRRLATAADRDPTGVALTAGLKMLREAGMPEDALGLGVGHWRPTEHTVNAGTEIVEAALDADRVSEARRHMAAMETHPDTAAVSRARAHLMSAIDEADRRNRQSAT